MDFRGFQEADGISRFACVWKGDIEVRKGSVQGFSMNSTDESKDRLIFQSSMTDELKPGGNILTLTGKVYFEYYKDFG